MGASLRPLHVIPFGCRSIALLGSPVALIHLRECRFNLSHQEIESMPPEPNRLWRGPRHRYMTTAQLRPSGTLASWLLKPLRWLFIALGFLFRVALIGWAALAIYYSNLPWARLRPVLAVAFAAFAFGPLEVTQTAQVIGLCRAVSDRARVVDLHPPPSSSMAAGGSGDAAGNHRWRPRTYHCVRNFSTVPKMISRCGIRSVTSRSRLSLRSISSYPTGRLDRWDIPF